MWAPFATGNHWSEEIADITGSPEYQTTTVNISSPGDLKTDPRTGQTTGSPFAIRYNDVQARIIGVRWGTFTQGEAQENSDSLKSVRLQIEKDYVDRIEKGWQVEVVTAPKNPALVGRRFRITNDFQGGSSATRTFECEISAD